MITYVCVEKKALIQARVNRQEKIDLGEIQIKLDKEFHEYKEKLQDTISQLKAALEHSRAKALSEEDTILIKKIYKKIVKKIHPDINPNITDKEKDLFVASTESYKNGDLNTLQIIYTIVTSGETEDDEALSLKSMEEEIERLEDLLGKIKSSIETIKSIPPYSWRIYVEDEEKKAEKLKYLKESLKSYKQAIRTQEEQIKELLKEEKWQI